MRLQLEYYFSIKNLRPWVNAVCSDNCIPGYFLWGGGGQGRQLAPPENLEMVLPPPPRYISIQGFIYSDLELFSDLYHLEYDTTTEIPLNNDSSWVSIPNVYNLISCYI